MQVRKITEPFSTDIVVERASNHFPENTIDFTRMTYKNARTKVELGCIRCGQWYWQSPQHLMTGRIGCPECRGLKISEAKRATKDSFLSKIIHITGDKYCFKDSIYKNAKTPMAVLCNDCGETFSKKPDHLFAGIGCRCHGVPFGFKPKETGTLYILTCGDITKVGITNNNIVERVKSVSKSYGARFEVLKEFIMDGQVCTDLETKLLTELRSVYKSPIEKFDGYTECFYYVDRAALINRIENELRNIK